MGRVNQSQLTALAIVRGGRSFVEAAAATGLEASAVIALWRRFGPAWTDS